MYTKSILYLSIFIAFSLSLMSCKTTEDPSSNYTEHYYSEPANVADEQFSNEFGFVISAISGPTGEDGTQATFTVRLKTAPKNNVIIGVLSSDLSKGTVRPSSLLFGTGNWGDDQTVTITGVDDEILNGNIDYLIVLSPSASNDQNYDGLDPEDVWVANVDNDIYQADSKAVSLFKFQSSDNPTLISDSTGKIDENSKTISAKIPLGTNITELVPSFTITGQYVSVGDKDQTSGLTSNNFSNPVIYTVNATDGTTQDYLVTVTTYEPIAILDLKFETTKNTFLTGEIIASIDASNKTITATVPYGTDVSALVATFSINGTLLMMGENEQVSGVTANDFTNPVVYTVVAGDGSILDYAVSIEVASSAAKNIKTFTFESSQNPTLSTNVTTNISGTSISAIVPYGTDISALVAAFSSNGVRVMIGETEQTSGETVNNFTDPAIYTVVAGDGSTQDYHVTVLIASADSKSIMAFTFDSDKNSALSEDIAAIISDTSISATVPWGTVITGLVATFSINGAAVNIGNTLQSSGVTVNDFTSSVTYTVRAEDGSTTDYNVTVIHESAKEITAFSFASNNAGLPTEVIATISGSTISAIVPNATSSLSSLKATFSTTGASVQVGSILQTSGNTQNDFTSPVIYTVTGVDGSTRDYEVIVTIAAADAKFFSDFQFKASRNSAASLTQDITASISGTNISATVPSGTDITRLVATFSFTGKSVKIGTKAQTSGNNGSKNDFSSPVIYTITAEDDGTLDYTVTVTLE